MSKREELRKRRQQQTRRTQRMVLGAIAALAVTVTGYLIYQNTRPIGEITTIEKETWPFTDGKALGAADTRVVIREFSDFQ